VSGEQAAVSIFANRPFKLADAAALVVNQIDGVGVGVGVGAAVVATGVGVGTIVGVATRNERGPKTKVLPSAVVTTTHQ
jgi:hypothetical protein